MCRRAKGLTLIEVLVVLSVIALLFSVLIPTLKVSKQKGTSLVCKANLRQLVMACQLYSQKNDDSYPPGFVSISTYGASPPGEAIGDLSADWYGWWWFYFIIDGIDNDSSKNSFLACPERKAQSKWILCGNYGINHSISKIRYSNEESEFLGTPLRSTQLKNPSRVYLLMDSGYTLVSWKASVNSSTEPEFDIPKRISSYYLPGLGINRHRDIAPDQEEDAVKGRHNKYINVGLADGHVETVKAKDWPIYAEDVASESTSLLASWRGR
jgi:prepilin-type N-terminal cleavage/methylation domain-containing protein/prepilin-type processing-associated H-X9-DG protein